MRYLFYFILVLIVGYSCDSSKRISTSNEMESNVVKNDTVRIANDDPGTKYGLEVNYLLYNYFKYFEQTYNQKLR